MHWGGCVLEIILVLSSPPFFSLCGKFAKWQPKTISVSPSKEKICLAVCSGGGEPGAEPVFRDVSLEGGSELPLCNIPSPAPLSAPSGLMWSCHDAPTFVMASNKVHVSLNQLRDNFFFSPLSFLLPCGYDAQESNKTVSNIFHQLRSLMACRVYCRWVFFWQFETESKTQNISRAWCSFWEAMEVIAFLPLFHSFACLDSLWSIWLVLSMCDKGTTHKKRSFPTPSLFAPASNQHKAWSAHSPQPSDQPETWGLLSSLLHRDQRVRDSAFQGQLHTNYPPHINFCCFLRLLVAAKGVQQWGVNRICGGVPAERQGSAALPPCQQSGGFQRKEIGFAEIVTLCLHTLFPIRFPQSKQVTFLDKEILEMGLCWVSAMN